MIDEREFISTTERVAYLTYILLSGSPVKTSHAANRFGMSWHGTKKMLDKMSGVIPITTADSGKWIMISSASVAFT